MSYSVTEEYFSGQGVCMIGTRDTNGKPAGLRPLGNVSALAIKNAVTTLEHKESTTGQRGTDLRLATDVKVSLDMTMENFNSENLAMTTRGTATVVPGASVTAEAINAYLGRVSPLAHIKTSAVVVKQGATTLIEYTNDSTPWDYKKNTDAGSLQFNDGAVLAWSAAGIVASGVTVGATTVITVANTAVAGGKVYLRGFAGADAAMLNNLSFTITVATPTAITIALDTTAKVITFATSKVVWDNMALTVDYTYASQTRTDAFTQGSPEMYMRFEGLNTAQNNAPVVVEIFKYSTDPTQDLSLISDTVQSFVMSGSVLKDSKQATGSQYYRVTKIDAA